MCYIHSAALVAEYLKSRGQYPGGSALFKSLSPNIVPDESSTHKDDGDSAGDLIYLEVSNLVLFYLQKKFNVKENV